MIFILFFTRSVTRRISGWRTRRRAPPSAQVTSEGLPAPASKMKQLPSVWTAIEHQMRTDIQRTKSRPTRDIERGTGDDHRAKVDEDVEAMERVSVTLAGISRTGTLTTAIFRPSLSPCLILLLILPHDYLYPRQPLALHYQKPVHPVTIILPTPSIHDGTYPLKSKRRADYNVPLGSTVWSLPGPAFVFSFCVDASQGFVVFAE